MKRDDSGIAPIAQSATVLPGRESAGGLSPCSIPQLRPIRSGGHCRAPLKPDWIDGKLALRVTAEDKQKTLECKGGFGGDRG